MTYITKSRSCNQFLSYLDEKEELANAKDFPFKEEGLRAIDMLRQDAIRIGNDNNASEASKHHYLKWLDGHYNLGVFDERVDTI